MKLASRGRGYPEPKFPKATITFQLPKASSMICRHNEPMMGSQFEA